MLKRGRYLLDTNTAIAVLEGQLTSAAWEPGSEVYLNATVLGELLYGVEKSTRIESNRVRVHRLTQRCPVLAVDADTAHHYGEIKNQVRKAGKPIPDNDLWIAAGARQHGLTLLSRDGHFTSILLEGFFRTTW